MSTASLSEIHLIFLSKNELSVKVALTSFSWMYSQANSVKNK